MELSTRDMVARAIATEILQGRGTAHGGVWLDVTHLSREQIETRLPVMLEQFLKFGVDIRTTPMEVAPTAHHIMGGLRITAGGQTTLPGLYACGEVAGGVHGANRLGGNALADTQVFGKRAGEAAGKAGKRRKTVDKEQVGIQLGRLAGFCAGNTNPAFVKRDLQLAMWQGAGIFRNAETWKRHWPRSHSWRPYTSGRSQTVTLPSAVSCRTCAARPRSSAGAPSSARSPAGRTSGPISRRRMTLNTRRSATPSSHSPAKRSNPAR